MNNVYAVSRALLMSVVLGVVLSSPRVYAAPSAAECLRIKQSVTALLAQRRDLQAEFQRAPTGEKPRLVSEIKEIGRQLAADRRAGAQCTSVGSCGHTICTPEHGNPRCKICRTDNCDGTASVSHSC